MGEFEARKRTMIFEDLAEAVESAVGFTHVVLNRYRPEEGDYEIIVLRGSPELERALGGATVSRESWMKLLQPDYERHGTYFIPEGEGDWGDGPVYDPPTDAGEGEGRWRAGDALFAPIRCPRGAILGILSVDVPRDGQRPAQHQILRLGALCAQAGAALDEAG